MAPPASSSLSITHEIRAPALLLLVRNWFYYFFSYFTTDSCTRMFPDIYVFLVWIPFLLAKSWTRALRPEPPRSHYVSASCPCRAVCYLLYRLHHDEHKAHQELFCGSGGPLPRPSVLSISWAARCRSPLAAVPVFLRICIWTSKLRTFELILFPADPIDLINTNYA